MNSKNFDWKGVLTTLVQRCPSLETSSHVNAISRALAADESVRLERHSPPIHFQGVNIDEERKPST